MSSLLPPNATPQEVAVAKTMARVSAVPAPFDSALDPMRAPEAMLPWLAWSFSVDTWGPDWPVYVRRMTVKRSLAIHRRKGTVGAMLDAIEAIGVPARVEEWHQRVPQADPFTFRVLIDSMVTPFRKEDLQRLLETVEATKNLRSHLQEVVPGLTSPSAVHTASVTAIGRDMAISARYSDVSLLLEAIEIGEPAAIAAADSLHTLLHITLPARETP